MFRMPFTTLDLIALAWFVAAWAGYAAQVEFMPKKKKSLNQLMNQYRLVWMQRMLHREARMVDMQVMATLVSGTAFFASTSLLAIGGALTILRSPDELLSVPPPFRSVRRPRGSLGKSRRSGSQ